MTPIEQYIRNAALRRSIDPEIAIRVARSEGGLNDPVRRAEYNKGGYREPSYGPYQLLIGGAGTGFPTGMGNDALAAGIDPRDPNQWQKGVDFALDQARNQGWGAWYGARDQGITGKMGINTTPGKIGGDSMVARNFDVQTAPATPLFGGLAPMMSPMMADSGITPSMVDHINSLSDKKPVSFGDRLSAAGAAFDKAANEFPAPGIHGAFSGDARQSGNALSQIMQSPGALARKYLQRRMG